MSDLQQSPVYKIALGIEYDGSKYYGWQRQNEVRSVQEKLEKALSQVANEPINVFCAGRTDAGVHGTGQVVHFETTALRSVCWARMTLPRFARYSASRVPRGGM